jgi:hypothetical protein
MTTHIEQDAAFLRSSGCILGADTQRVIDLRERFFQPRHAPERLSSHEPQIQGVEPERKGAIQREKCVLAPSGLRQRYSEVIEGCRIIRTQRDGLLGPLERFPSLDLVQSLGDRFSRLIVSQSRAFVCLVQSQLIGCVLHGELLNEKVDAAIARFVERSKDSKRRRDFGSDDSALSARRDPIPDSKCRNSEQLPQQ